ncbi:MAG TPA: hypothetical protein VK988_04655 [Acidimicrobiales bacterium]|nr:hypothetical protein [Acidimicrobiales bacterium]
MDASSFELLRFSVEGQAQRLRSVLAALGRDQRGSTYVEFVDRHLAALESLAAITANDFTGASEAEKTIYGRKLSRVRSLLNELHGEVFDFRNDVGRRDLPSGLLYLIDYLIEDLLKASGDPIIHLDGNYMYSTQRLVDRWRNFSKELGVGWVEPAEPVIFNLPGLDPGNALLAPVLAHEVGHSVIQRHDLVSEVGARLDVNAVDGLTKNFRAAEPSADVDDALRQFAAWTVELLCDALATELTGPCFLFSVAVFFPASAAGQSGANHPDPAQRFELALYQLSSNGWTSALQRLAPDLFAWLQAVAKTPPLMSVSPREAFLRKLVDLARPTIAEVAHEYVDASLDWTAFEHFEEVLEELLNAGIPPAELAGDPVPPWHVVASIWLYAISVHGDSPRGLVASVDDADLSRFALKTIEMSRVLQLWKADDAPAA